MFLSEASKQVCVYLEKKKTSTKISKFRHRNVLSFKLEN